MIGFDGGPCRWVDYLQNLAVKRNVETRWGLMVGPADELSAEILQLNDVAEKDVIKELGRVSNNGNVRPRGRMSNNTNIRELGPTSET